MNASPLRLAVGEARITVFDAGEIRYDLAENLNVDESAWRLRYGAEMSKPVHLPMQSTLIQTPQTTVLVDAPAYDLASDSPFAIQEYTPPPGLLEQMAAADIDPGAIEHVLITHAHWDHYNGLTVWAEGEGWTPAFPNAPVYLGRADWESADMREALTAPDSLPARTFGIIASLGRLVPVDGQRQIAPGIHLIPTPGESPGHMTVRVSSEGRTLYCVGDLYHHRIEVEQPAWAAPWAELDSIRASRAAFSAVALEEDALVIVSHIHGVGRLARTAEGVTWVKA